jgi:hypothetical protein
MLDDLLDQDLLMELALIQALHDHAESMLSTAPPYRLE